MSYALDRLDPASFDKGQIERLLQALQSGPCLVGPDGARFALPEPFVRLVAHAAQAVRLGQSVALMPEKETLTTQEAADYMGFSRPFLIGLLEKGEIPFHRVGTHRKILFNDLRDYEFRRDRERRKALNDLFDAIDQDGFYELGLDPALGEGG